MNLILKRIMSLFQADPLVRLLISVTLLIGLLFIVSLLPESIKIKAGIGVVVFVGILNFRTVLGIFKDVF